MDGRIKRERKIENVSVGHGNSTGLIFREKSGLKSVLYLDVRILQYWEHMCIIQMLVEKELFQHVIAVIKGRQNFL